jgi:aryl-alcohol dehydrogenase-like predicted oxidoreductase
MKTRRLGRTGLQVSELIFGGGWVGGILVHQDDDTKRHALQLALDSGINWIDTAPLYGQGKSEESLGWLLKEAGQTPYLSTKFTIDPAHKGDISGQVDASLEQSLKRLQRDSVDLLQLHNQIKHGRDGASLTPGEVLQVADALDRLRQQGAFKYIGITALGDASACCEVINSGRFDTAQVYYNLLNPSAGRTMPSIWSGHDYSGIIGACQTHDVGIMAIRVFAAGILATDVRHGREIMLSPDTEVATEERRARTAFAELGDKYGTHAQTAIRFVLANPAISGAIIGLAELSHLQEALAGAEAGPLPSEALTKLDDLYAQKVI